MSWPIIWTAWALALAVSFAVLEGIALHLPTGLTLSRCVYNLTLAWPPTEFILGLIVGGLAVHFWWHWNP